MNNYDQGHAFHHFYQKLQWLFASKVEAKPQANLNINITQLRKAADHS